MTRPPYQSLPVLTEQACDRVVGILLSLRSSWIPRSPVPSGFFSLGAATYMDLVPPDKRTAAYAELLASYNDILRGNFAELLEAVRMALQKATGRTVLFSTALPLPGFHIWLSSAIQRTATASLHFDLQYMSLIERKIIPPPDETISYTLPICIPQNGAGLSFWNIDYNAPCAPSVEPQPLQQMVAGVPANYLPYQRGVLVVHSGNFAHQIAPTEHVYPADMRITLQGHGVRYGNVWALYW